MTDLLRGFSGTLTGSSIPRYMEIIHPDKEEERTPEEVKTYMLQRLMEVS